MDQLLTLPWKILNNQACVETEIVPPLLSSGFKIPNKEEAMLDTKAVLNQLQKPLC